MMNVLNLNNLTNRKSKNIKIGELSQEVINVLNLNLNPQNINLWTPRIFEHCEKHKSEYSSPQAYYQAITHIPEIISSPDYVGIHKNGNIQYIKRLDDISLVGIQILKGSKSLLFRTVFPITEEKLNYSIKTNKFYKI